MIELINSIFSEGDSILLNLTTGESLEGVILKITPSSIAIKTNGGKIKGIREEQIENFENVISDISGKSEDIINTIENTNNEKTSDKDKNHKKTNTNNLNLSKEIINTSDTVNNEQEEIKENITEKEKKEIKNPCNYKPGDVMPLDELEKLTGSKPRIKKDKQKLTSIGTGLESLSILVSKEHEEENRKIVPSLGTIKSVFIDRRFGFIRDAHLGKNIYFSLNQFIDKSITISSTTLTELPVIYSIQEDERGEKAMSIHKSGKVSELIKLAQDLEREGEYKHAAKVIEHVLNEYPNNFAAYQFREKLYKTHSQLKPKVYYNLYEKAKKYKLAKDYTNAIDFLKKAIEAGEKLESSIKDLGSLYVQLYKMDENESGSYRELAIKLIDDYKSELPNTLSTLYYLENFYYSIQDYDNFIKVAENLLDNKTFSKDKSRYSQLLCKIAVAYVQSNDIDQAIDKIEEALAIDSTNVWAVKLKAAIESNENKEDLIEAITATQFESLTSGLSSFIQQTLNEHEDYLGVPAKVIESRDFTETTLKGIRGLIEKTAGRSRARAPYLLTEAKLIQDIEPENTTRLRTILARYCNDMAKNHIADNSSLDVIRFFYNEAFALEENYDNNAQSVAYYLLLHIYNYSELTDITSRQIPVDTALKKTISSEFEFKIWLNILTMFLYNRVITAKLTSLFFSNKSYRENALKALKYFGREISNNPTKVEFTEAWNLARETLKRYNGEIVAHIKTIANAISLEDIYQQLFSIKDIKKDWLCALDINRLYAIVNIIVPALGLYIKSTGYRNKEGYKTNANGQIMQLIEEIKSEPTKISYEELLPLLELILKLLDTSFKEVIRMSEPRIKIELLSERTVINDDGSVKIQIEISNHRDSSPIKEVFLSIEKQNDLNLVDGGEIVYNAIEGGESNIFKLKFSVSDVIIRQKATPVTIICNYKNGNENKQVSSQISLKLYSQNEFTPIQNPYAPFADGGPVPVDSNMFFGRETEINNIVDSIIKSPSKQIIIYGQKRSGKSSVMAHLKQSLINTGKTFCISFSLGDIINTLNESSFYYKIISSIKDELEFMELDGNEHIPDFIIPTAKDFKDEDPDNPLNTFTKYMRLFKLACSKTEGWKDKNLVVMIDEFTYLYTEIKNGNLSPSIMKQWKAITQNERAQFSVVMVGQDVVPSFKKEDYARNAFGVIQDMRLTYLKEEPARQLIEYPILDENGNSRYIGDAVSKIIEYTSRNPYYIQIFCSRLVDFMNENKSISVTEADVNEVARSFIYGSEALEEDKFDNLIRAGESENLQEHSEVNILSVLREIAINSKNVGYCNRNEIDVIKDKEEENSIIKDLCDREVLEVRGKDIYKIQVKLFQEWLLIH